MLAQAKKGAKGGSKASKLQCNEREHGANDLPGNIQSKAISSLSQCSEHEQSIRSTSLASQEPDATSIIAHLHTAASMAGSNSKAEEASATTAEADDIDELLLAQLLGGMAVSQSGPFGKSRGSPRDGQEESAMPLVEPGVYDQAGSSVQDTTEQCGCDGQLEIVLAERKLPGQAEAGPSSDDCIHGEVAGVELFGRKGAAPAMLRMLRCPLSQVSVHKAFSLLLLRCVN